MVERCKALGLEVKSHASSLTDEQVKAMRRSVQGAAVVEEKKKPSVEKKSAAKGVVKTKAGVEKVGEKLHLKIKKGPVARRVLRITRKKEPGKPETTEPAKPAGTATWTGELKVVAPARETVGPAVQEKPREQVAAKQPHGLKAAPVKHEPVSPQRESKVKVLFRPEGGQEAPVSRGRIKVLGKAVGRIELESEEAARKKRIATKGRDEWRTTAMRTLTAEEEEQQQGRRPGFRRVKVHTAPVIKARPTEVELVTPVTIKDFSGALGIRGGQIISKLMTSGVMANINHVLSEDMVKHLAEEFNVKVTLKEPKDITTDFIKEQEAREDQPEDLKQRGPVVTFMGHVDHGKTSLLDAIRKANVVDTESGGITQHMGAYRVTRPDGKSVVFLDTPGHEAFTAMRARGANVTDVVVLVVAADDGVMPQTEEAINHARAAGVPIVVAVNKVDKPGINVLRVKQQLVNVGLQSEEWGGKTLVVETSAVTKKGLDELVEMLWLEAEMLELKANPNRPAVGTVLEARLTEGRGSTATVLIRNGTLHVGDAVLCGVAYGRVRAMYDDRGQVLQEAGPATPVTVLGLSEGPEAGDTLYTVADLSHARDVAEVRARKWRQAELGHQEPITLENLFAHLEAGRVKALRIVLKADVKGSVEVLKSSIEKVATAEVKVDVLHAAVGAVNESDVLLAHASEAIIIGFHVVPDDRARMLAQEKGVEIRLYQVIYQVLDEVKKALEGLLEPERREVVSGHIEVRNVFKVSHVGTIAGCYVTDGVVPRNAKVRVYRDGVQVYEGTLESLRRFKDDVREVREGFECGVKVANFDDVKVGDRLEAYHIEEIARKLE